MDKLMDNKWFMKIAALISALLLFSSVPRDDTRKAADVNVPSEQNMETIEAVPVKSYYDTENLILTGVPETVDVTIQGPNNIVQSAKLLRGFEVYVDLANAEIGTQKVPIRVRKISDRLKATIKPAYATVTLQERVTKEFRVEAEYNRGLLEDGYIAEQAVVEPNKVKITGSKDVIDRISYVKATLDVKGPIRDTVSSDAGVRVLDRELNKLNVTVEPDTVKVTLPVKSVSRTVPINIVQNGTLPDGVTIESISLDKNEATISGTQEVLEAAKNVRVEVDVSKINENTELTLPVIIPEGINKVTPELVKAKVTVRRTKTEEQTASSSPVKTEEKTISNIPIKTEGLSDNYAITFKDPANGAANLTVSGPSDVLAQLTASDFNLLVDVSNLQAGDHEVQIQAKGPDDVNWNLAKQTVKVSITQKEEI